MTSAACRPLWLLVPESGGGLACQLGTRAGTCEGTPAAGRWRRQSTWVLISLCPQMREEGGGKEILLSRQVILIRPMSGLQMVSASNLDVGAEC